MTEIEKDVNPPEFEKDVNPPSFEKKLARFLAEVENPLKTSSADVKKYTYTYSDMAEVDSVVKPALERNGLSMIQGVQPRVSEDGEVSYELVTRIFDDAKEMVVDIRPIFFGSDAQRNGSFETYSRRYAKITVCGIAPVDDDGRMTAGSEMPSPETIGRIRDGVSALERAGIDPSQTLDAFSGYEVDASLADGLLVALRRRYSEERSRKQVASEVEREFPGASVTEVL